MPKDELIDHSHLPIVWTFPLPDAPAGIAETVKVYNPKSGKQWRLALIAFGLSALGLIPLKQIFDWLSGGARPGGGVFLAACCSLFFFPLGVIVVANVLRGLPRLTVTPEGPTLEAGIRTKRARWIDLEPFAVKTVYSGRSRQVRTASAKMVGSDASQTGFRARNFVIPDQFDTPIDALVTEINVARARATGDTRPAATAVAAFSKQEAIGLEHLRVPWLTLTLLTVLIVVFTLENALPVTPGGKGLAPSIATLIAFGASSHRLVVTYHQWFRLFTAPLLHANLAHIVGNGIALVWGGWLLERLVGRLWFFAFFVIGALGGSLLSIAVNPANLVSVGASGALMGLFAALFVGSFRHASGTATRTRLQFNSLRILVPSLLPILQASSVERIDYGAHIGGALSGAALALVLLKHWPEGARVPQLRKLAAAISAVGALLFVASGGLTAVTYPKFAQALRHAQVAAPSLPPAPQSDILSDHGPRRVACDTRWAALHLHDPGAYRVFLQRCMNENSTGQ